MDHAVFWKPTVPKVRDHLTKRRMFVTNRASNDVLHALDSRTSVISGPGFPSQTGGYSHFNSTRAVPSHLGVLFDAISVQNLGEIHLKVRTTRTHAEYF